VVLSLMTTILSVWSEGVSQLLRAQRQRLRSDGGSSSGQTAAAAAPTPCTRNRKATETTAGNSRDDERAREGQGGRTSEGEDRGEGAQLRWSETK
jgi:hypothetical protein